jgi:hypothetical protein
MELPILEKLKDGEKFDFATLAENVEQTNQFLEWWWEEKAQPGVIMRPEVIQDDEPILKPTIGACAADFISYAEFFDKTLHRLTEHGVIPTRSDLSREAFRSFLLRIVTNSSVILPGRPQIVFAGGGYGSGKTTILNHLAENECLPVGLSHLVGVDVFKPLVPEFNLIKAVGDGRASLTVQKECQELADELFETLIEARRSFVWDSSMSNQAETLERLKLADLSGYELTMVAVLTPTEQAVRQAMRRACQSRRFPHPEALPKSHIGFRQAFVDYLGYFDRVTVFANDARLGEAPLVIAEKQGRQNALVPMDKDLLESALCQRT